MTPKISTNDYERTPRAPLTTPMNTKSSKSRVQIAQPLQTSILPPTPISSCKVTVTSIYHIPKREPQQLSPPRLIEHRQLPPTSQKTPFNEHALSPLSNRSTYRAHRVQIEPTIEFPPPPSDIEDIENTTTNKQHDYEDMNTPSFSKRPSHNLLSNIFPSIATPSTDQSSQQSTKHVASSFGFDTSIEPRHINDTTIHSNTDTYAQNDEQIELESVSSDDEDNDYESNKIDYICKSTSTVDIASPSAHTYYA